MHGQGHGFWLETDGTLVAELSTLQANNHYNDRIVCLPGEAGLYNLRNAYLEEDSEGDITGWRFEFKGQKYLVIND